MDEEGVNVQILSMVGPMVYFNDAEAAIEMARISNDAIAEACHQRPARFGGLCCLPLAAGPDALLAELRRCVEDLDIWGMTVGANVAGRWALPTREADRTMPSPTPVLLSERLFYDCLGFQPASLCCAEDVVGSGRFRFGTGYPFCQSMILPIQLLEDMDWAQDVKEGVFHQNVQKIFPKIP